MSAIIKSVVAKYCEPVVIASTFVSSVVFPGSGVPFVGAFAALVSSLFCIDRAALSRSSTKFSAVWAPGRARWGYHRTKMLIASIIMLSVVGGSLFKIGLDARNDRISIQNAIRSFRNVNHRIAEMTKCEDDLCIKANATLVASVLEPWTGETCDMNVYSTVKLRDVYNLLDNSSVSGIASAYLGTRWLTYFDTLMLEHGAILPNVTNNGTRDISAIFTLAHRDGTGKQMDNLRPILAYHLNHGQYRKYAQTLGIAHVYDALETVYHNGVRYYPQFVIPVFGPNAVTIPTTIKTIVSSFRKDVTDMQRILESFPNYWVSADIDAIIIVALRYVLGGCINHIPLLIKILLQIYIVPMTSIIHLVILGIATQKDTTGPKYFVLSSASRALRLAMRTTADVSLMMRRTVSAVLIFTIFTLSSCCVIGAMLNQVGPLNKGIKVDLIMKAATYSVPSEAGLCQLAILFGLALLCSEYRSKRDSLSLNSSFSAFLRGERTGNTEAAQTALGIYVQRRNVYRALRIGFFIASFISITGMEVGMRSMSVYIKPMKIDFQSMSVSVQSMGIDIRTAAGRWGAWDDMLIA